MKIFLRIAVYLVSLHLGCTSLLFAEHAGAPTGAVDAHAPVGYTGFVVSYSDTSVTLTDKDGKTTTVAMVDGWTVVSPRTLDLAALKVGDFIASPNVNIDAGSGRPTEVRVMEAGYKPEQGTHPMGQPNTSMTHGTITKITQSGPAIVLTVSYDAGSRALMVDPGTKVIGYEVHGRAAAKPGVSVTAVTRKDADGTPRAARLILAP